MNNYYCIVKRLFDFLFSFFAIVILLIPWLFIAVVIFLQSPGPIMYKAKRVGIHGNVFTMYKFRTMDVNSGQVHLTTLKNDERIYPFGHFLRDSKLDETPQFFNVLKGDMTIIGPRPEDYENVEIVYTGVFKEILNVKPGLSSPASLYDYTHGERLYNDEELYFTEFYPQKLELELYYVHNQSVLYDLKIFIRTIIVIFALLLGKTHFPLPPELNYIGEMRLK